MSEVGGSLGRQMSGSEMSEVGKCLVVICLVGRCLVGKRPGTINLRIEVDPDSA